MMKKLALVLFLLMAFASSSYAEYSPGYSGSGSGLTSGDPKWIVTADDLRTLGNQVNADTEPSGRYYVLSRDLNMIYTDYISIGNVNCGRPFSGHFDGNNKTIYVQIHPLREDDEELLSQDRALFGYIRTTGDYAVKDLHVGGYAKGYNAAGIVSILSAGEIVNCTVSGDFEAFSIAGSEEEENKINAGGIVAYITGGVVSNCVFSGNVSADGGDFQSTAGGIAGIMSGGQILRSTVKHYAKISAKGNTEDNNPENAGGIVGFATVEDVYTNDSEDTVTYCTFEGGEITSTHYAGGITGYARGGQYTHNTVGSDTRILAARIAGGIAGRLEAGGYVFSNDVEGGIVSSDTSSAGGVAGYLMLGYVKDNSAKASVKGTSPYKGGVVGQIDNTYGSSSNITGNIYKGSDYAIGKDEHNNTNVTAGSTKFTDATLYFITPSTLPDAYETELYSSTIEMNLSTDFDLSPIPSWMNPQRNGAVILLRGTPQASNKGTASFTLSPVYGQQTISKTFQITVNPQLTITDVDDVTANPGDYVEIVPRLNTHNFDVSSNSGSNGFTWSVLSGDLPSSLAINTQSGKISGYLRTSGVFSRILQVTPADTRLSVVSKSITIYVGYNLGYGVSVSSDTVLPDAITGHMYSHQLSADIYGFTSVTWSADNSQLPVGLSLNNSGLISGVPLVAGRNSFLVHAVASGDISADKVLTITVRDTAPLPSITITTSSLPSGKVGEFYSASLQASVSGAVWSQSGGLLPPGLKLGIDGTISGTPSVYGQFIFTVSASAQDYSEGRQQYTITIEQANSGSSSSSDVGSSGGGGGGCEAGMSVMALLLCGTFLINKKKR